MFLFSSISNAEVYTVLTTVILMPILFLVSLISVLVYFNKKGRRGGVVFVFTALLFINALILGIHQLFNNEPGLVLAICIFAFVYSLSVLFFLSRSRRT